MSTFREIRDRDDRLRMEALDQARKHLAEWSDHFGPTRPSASDLVGVAAKFYEFLQGKETITSGN